MTVLALPENVKNNASYKPLLKDKHKVYKNCFWVLNKNKRSCHNPPPNGCQWPFWITH